MPVYAYKCKQCGEEQTDVRAVKARNRPAKCRCGGRAIRALALETPKSERDYASPILSDAMGVHPSQVDEHRRRFPDIPMTDDGRVVIRNKAEGRRIRKALGFFDRSGYSR
jgi:putative FmdB family regulatory protein